MRSKLAICGCLLAGFWASLSAANAAVIAGPALPNSDSGYNVTGLEFHALDNSTLTSFVFQNQGLADVVILTDASGNILNSLATPSGTPSYTASVNWALTVGNDYWLFQQTSNNDKWASFGAALPSDSDIAILFSGAFSQTGIPGALADTVGFASNQYWAAFNNITTSAGTSSVPEPLTLSLFGVGLAGAVAMRRRKAKA